MTTYNDHDIEYWAEVFQACRLTEEGVNFEDFLATPRAILHAFGMADAPEVMADGFLPLLPRQARVRARLERPEPVCETVNGGLVRLAPVRADVRFTGRERFLVAA
ncbi:MAG: hypothetical protein AB1670_06530 [Pseudomonadota bacterium]